MIAGIQRYSVGTEAPRFLTTSRGGAVGHLPLSTALTAKLAGDFQSSARALDG